MKRKIALILACLMVVMSLPQENVYAREEAVCSTALMEEEKTTDLTTAVTEDAESIMASSEETDDDEKVTSEEIVSSDSEETTETNEVTEESTEDLNGEMELFAADADGFEIVGTILKKYSGSATEVVIPAGIKTIGDNAFANNSSIISVDFSKASVEEIGFGAFNSCTKLKTINLPDSLKKIGGSALSDTAIESLTIPVNVESIGDFAFSGSAVSTLVVKTNKAKYVGSAFSNCELKDITFPEGITEIPDNMFYGADFYSEADVTVTIPASVTKIGKSAFSSYGGGLDYVVFEKGSKLEEIGEKAFYNDNALKKIILPDSLKKIGDSAFYKCKALTELNLGNGVEEIGISAFFECTNIEKLTLPESLKIIGNSAFWYLEKIEEVVFPKSLTFVGYNAFANCESLYKVTINSDPFLVGSEDDGNGSALFKGCPLLEVRINNLNRIPDSMFFNANFGTGSTVYINADVTSIGEEAFANSKIQNIVFAEGSKLKTIEDKAFYCTSINDSKLKELVIPNGTEKIGEYAFKNNYYLEKLYIPDSIIEIKHITGCDNTKFYVTKGTYAYNKLVEWGLINNIVATLGIKYELGSGAVNASSNPTKFDEGDILTLAEPSRAGYNFLGWYTNADYTGSSVTSFDTSGIKDNITFYAKWEAYKYTVKFNYNLPSGILEKVKAPLPSDISLEFGKSGQAPSTKESINKYAFNGWNTQADGSGTSYKAGAQIKDLTDKDGAVVTLYAQWLPSTYTVKYDANIASLPAGARATGRVANSTFTYGKSDNKVTATQYTVAGYEFLGWTGRADGKGTAYQSGESVGCVLERSEMDKGAVVTMYAKWKPTGYALTLHYNYEGAPDDKVITINTSTVLSANGVSRDGYNLVSWNTKADGKGKKYALTAKGLNADTELYAQWSKPLTYKITYQPEGGRNSTKNPKSFTIASNELALYEPVKTGYTFEGWEIIEGSIGGIAVGEKLSAGSNTLKIPAGTYGNIVLKACWRENVYTVRFHNTGALYDQTDTIVKNGYYYYSEIIELCYLDHKVEEADGKAIIGWTTLPKGKGKFYGYSSKVTMLGGKTADDEDVIDLYAKWGTPQYAIEYNFCDPKDGVKNTNPHFYTYNKALNLKNPTRPGYIFTGWKYFTREKETGIRELNDKCNQIVKGVKGTVSLIATWEPITYRVQLNLNTKEKEIKFNTSDGKAPTYADISYVDDELCTLMNDIVLPATDENNPEYIRLVSWNTSANGKGISVPINEDGKSILAGLTKTNKGLVKLYAQWEYVPFNITYVNVDPTDSEAELEDVKNTNITTYTYSSTKAYALKNPTKYGFVFKGWYSDSSFAADKKITSIPKGSKGDVTIYGKWELK